MTVDSALLEQLAAVLKIPDRSNYPKGLGFPRNREVGDWMCMQCNCSISYESEAYQYHRRPGEVDFWICTDCADQVYGGER